MAELAETVAIEAAETARELGHPVLATVGVPAPMSAEPLALLSRDASGWWSQPGLSVAGSGIADECRGEGNDKLSNLTEAVRRLFDGSVSRGRGPIAFAGARFNGGPASDGWEPFPEASAWVPEVAIVDEDSERWLVATVSVSRGEEVAARAHLMELLSGDLHVAGRDNLRASRLGEFTPTDDGYADGVETALDLIDAGELRKVVLARRLRTRTSANAASVSSALSERYPSFYGYAVVREGSAFVGASPELLVETDGVAVRSAPAAATVGRTDSESTNRKLAGGLDSIKSRWEQELVADAVYDTLEPLCDPIHASLPMVVSAGPVQHLSTAVDGRLIKPVHVLELVAALHPTPAVGGLPRETSSDFIAKTERFDRGWYAGPIGIVRPDGSGTFAVALRGALLHDGVIDLFAGAGIVEGSIPEEESREVEMKLRSVASVLQPSD